MFTFFMTRRLPSVWLSLLTGGLCLLPVHARTEEPLRPPGDCSEVEHRQLKQEVGRACKATSMKCYEHQGCSELLANWLTHQRCIGARRTIMNKCFRGGDKGHRDEVENYERGAADCTRLMTQKRCPEQCR